MQPYNAQDILRMTNEYRSSLGLKPVTLNDQLSKAALAHAQDITTNRYWAHNSPSGKTWDSYIYASGYPIYKPGEHVQYYGENLANGYNSATSTMAAWKASPEHNKNLISPNYSDMGAAVIPGTSPAGKPVYYVVQTFGSQVPETQKVTSPATVKLPNINVPTSNISPKKAILNTMLTAPSGSRVPSPLGMPNMAKSPVGLDQAKTSSLKSILGNVSS
jgi:hypothetical protein